MVVERGKLAPLGALCVLALPMLLAHCADADSVDAAMAGADAGVGAAPSGAAGALGGGAEAGGSQATEAGAAGAPESGGFGGNAAAGSPTEDAGSGADAGAAGAALGAAGSGACDVELSDFTSPSALHVSVCSPISYPMNPPVYGDHYPVWSAYKSYSFPVPLGFLVHNLEHGAIVLLYNCAAGCRDEVATAQAFIDALPADPRCTIDVKHQVVMAPDPDLPTRWAAVAWGHSLAAGCFEPLAFHAFYDAHVGHGGEDICSDGADLSATVCQ